MSRWVLQGIKFYNNVSHAPPLQEAHLGISYSWVHTLRKVGKSIAPT